MTSADCFASVVAPLENDEDIVRAFVVEVCSTLQEHYTNHELVLVDDGSTDGTVAAVKSLMEIHEGLRLIRLSRRFGLEIAISAGLDSVIGDFTVVMLPDTDPPGKIHEMIERARQGAGIVYGIRSNRHGQSLMTKLGTAGFYWYHSRVLKLRLPKDSTHFRTLSRQAVNAITSIRDHGRYLRTLSHYVGYGSQSFTYDPIQRRERPRGKGLIEQVELALDIIISNSVHPLRSVVWIGYGLAFLNFSYMVYVVSTYLLKETVAEGWATTSLQIATTSAFLFLLLAVISQYVGRLVMESKGRPLYYVMEELQSRTAMADTERPNVVTESLDDARRQA